MPNDLDPIVGQWYVHRDKGEMFRVVAADVATGAIEIQSFDGDVEELDGEAWRDMDIEAGEAPEDWTGPFDDVEPDDLGYAETAMSTQDWRASLEPLPRTGEAWQETRARDELEEEEEEGRPAEPYIEESEAASKRLH